jgi:hypothetical protein
MGTGRLLTQGVTTLTVILSPRPGVEEEPEASNSHTATRSSLRYELTSHIVVQMYSVLGANELGRIKTIPLVISL